MLFVFTVYAEAARTSTIRWLGGMYRRIRRPSVARSLVFYFLFVCPCLYIYICFCDDRFLIIKEARTINAELRDMGPKA